MTIVKDLKTLTHHPLVAIDQDVAALISKGAEIRHSEGRARALTVHLPLKLLEAYCDITGQRITMDTLRSPEIEKILQGFAAAVAGEHLIKLSRPDQMKQCRHIYDALSAAKTEVPDLFPVEWNFLYCEADDSICRKVAAADDFKRWYWQGWSIQRKGYPGAYPRIAQLVIPYGREFVSDVFRELELHYEGRTNTFRPEWSYMFDYLTEHHQLWPLSTLKTDSGLREFMNKCTTAYFKRAKKEKRDPKSQIKNWNRFIGSVEECLCKTGIWAKISLPLRRPPPATKHGSETKISKKGDNGIVVQEKLLTDIPLYVTDEQAVELLFFHIKKDVATVRSWASAQAKALLSRCDYRLSLAQEGTPINYEKRGSVKKHSIVDVCATLEDPSSTISTAFLCKVYNYHSEKTHTAAEIAHNFGFAVAGSLFPLQCLLVLEHPEITTQFLKGFELYNEQGQLVGFDEEKRLLIGYKNRKTPDLREQIIQLNDISFGVVKNIIKITDIGRRVLKHKGDDQWRSLFITSGKAFSSFKRASIRPWNEHTFANDSRLRDKLIAEFRPHSDLGENDLVEFAKRVQLTAIRASRAIEIFIQTKSTEKMSEALGHEHYYPDLLSHYLPDEILAFVKSRWIRVFQKSMVCEAMKDSPHLLRVTKFNTMDELHAFLEQHRIAEIPSQASDPERKAQREEIEQREAILSISVPFLASLLSLEAAVAASNDRPRICGKAEYWASFAQKITSEISSGVNRLLKTHLAKASTLVDAKKMEALIYVPAHWS